MNVWLSNLFVFNNNIRINQSVCDTALCACIKWAYSSYPLELF